MVRKLWIGTLAAALCCSTPGWSQLLQPDRWIMVSEEGKSPVKCKVVRVCKQENGSTICLARTQTGEMITLVEEVGAGPSQMRVIKTEPGQPSDPRPSTLPTSPSNPQPSPKPDLKPVPTDTIKPTVAQKKPEPAKEKQTLFGRLFGSSKSTANKGKEATKCTKEPDLAARTEANTSRPQLPIAGPVTDDPLNRPDVYTKSQGAVSTDTPKSTQATRMPVGKPKQEPGLLGRMFGQSAPTTAAKETGPAQAVTPPVQLAMNPPPAPSPLPEPTTTVAKEPVPTQTITPPTQATTAPTTPLSPLPLPGSTPGKVVRTKDDSPGWLARMRARLTSPRQETAPKAPNGLMPGMGSVAAADDRGLARQSNSGLRMVRTPAGTTAMMPDEMVTRGMVSVPVSASNAFTLSMPTPSGMPGSMPGMPIVAMQPPAMYDRGVPNGAANAFTQASPVRPIPSDFGPPPQAPNAFVMAGMGGAYTRPPMGFNPNAHQAAMMPTQPSPAPMMSVLRGSILPSEREQAAEALSRVDWRGAPEAVAALIISARSDPAPMVRVGCVRALARMKVNTVPVYEAMQELKTDKDIRVRQEAEQSLAAMTTAH